MSNKIVKKEHNGFECPTCGYTWINPADLSFNEEERVPCCPNCGELIEDGGDY